VITLVAALVMLTTLSLISVVRRWRSRSLLRMVYALVMLSSLTLGADLVRSLTLRPLSPHAPLAAVLHAMARR
jgi:hypothetical protein